MAEPQPTTLHDEIHDELVRRFAPSVLEVINESRNHNVPPNSETHFKVVVVAEGFAEHTLVARHRAVNEALAGPLARGVHALAIQALTPAEWTKRGGVIPPSPPCLGGRKLEAGN